MRQRPVRHITLAGCPRPRYARQDDPAARAGMGARALEGPNGLAGPKGLDEGPPPLRAAITYVSGMTDRFAFSAAVELLGWDPERLPRGIDAAGPLG